MLFTFSSAGRLGCALATLVSIANAVQIVSTVITHRSLNMMFGGLYDARTRHQITFLDYPAEAAEWSKKHRIATALKRCAQYVYSVGGSEFILDINSMNMGSDKCQSLDLQDRDLKVASYKLYMGSCREQARCRSTREFKLQEDYGMMVAWNTILVNGTLEECTRAVADRNRNPVAVPVNAAEDLPLANEPDEAVAQAEDNNEHAPADQAIPVDVLNEDIDAAPPAQFDEQDDVALFIPDMMEADAPFIAEEDAIGAVRRKFFFLETDFGFTRCALPVNFQGAEPFWMPSFHGRLSVKPSAPKHPNLVSNSSCTDPFIPCKDMNDCDQFTWELDPEEGDIQPRPDPWQFNISSVPIHIRPYASSHRLLYERRFVNYGVVVNGTQATEAASHLPGALANPSPSTTSKIKAFTVEEAVNECALQANNKFFRSFNLVERDTGFTCTLIFAEIGNPKAFMYTDETVKQSFFYSANLRSEAHRIENEGRIEVDWEQLAEREDGPGRKIVDWLGNYQG